MPSTKKTALVTGAGIGIGKAICDKLADRFRIFAVSRNQNHLNEIALSINNVLVLKANLVTLEGQELLLGFLKTHGFPHIVISNLSTSSERKKLVSISSSIIQKKLTENIDHLLAIMTPVLEFQRREKYGRWIGISSMSAVLAVPGMSIYNMQKTAMESLFRTLATEEGKYEITANIVTPGIIATPSVLENYTPDKLEQISKQNVMQRAGTPAEVAAAVAFLAGEDATYITGINLPVNGGNHLAWNFL
jgi:meso-butanediol dehydrogenase/(S,S)-butanediol dehydrogenase/diacetyl reductase